tara:strand:+ start:279 stop:581 length:303 start_codon:yes stop_codon:yes gene_type:complete
MRNTNKETDLIYNAFFKDGTFKQWAENWENLNVQDLADLVQWQLLHIGKNQTFKQWEKNRENLNAAISLFDILQEVDWAYIHHKIGWSIDTFISSQLQKV